MTGCFGTSVPRLAFSRRSVSGSVTRPGVLGPSGSESGRCWHRCYSRWCQSEQVARDCFLRPSQDGERSSMPTLKQSGSNSCHPFKPRRRRCDVGRRLGVPDAIELNEDVVCLAALVLEPSVRDEVVLERPRATFGSKCLSWRDRRRSS
jgi:hypothetical protein